MKKLLASTIAAAMLAAGAITASAANTSYSDVSPGAWYAPAVNIVTSHGLMNGIGNNQFAPNDSVSRAMIVQILYNQAGKPNVGGNAVFSDVKQGAWYYNAVQWAAQNKVASGVGNGKFAPDAKVTRQDFAVFLYRNSGSPSVSGSLNLFDANQVSSWAKNALLWANQNGIVNGTDAGKLLPQNNAIRAEAAQMLSNYLNVSKPGHSYGDGKVTKAATCTNSGEKTYTCSICGKTKTETIPATGHKVVTDKAVAPTCTASGKTEGSHCSVCNVVIKAQTTVPATGHNYDSETVTKEAGCTWEGVKTYTCKTCGATKTESIAKLGHDFSSISEITVKPTCNSEGNIKYTCSRCGFMYTDVIPRNDDHNYVEEITKAATCTEAGVKAYTCTRCDKSYTEAIPAIGHNYEGKVTKETTCTEDGVKTYTCENCGNSYTETIAKLGHDLKAKYEVIVGYRPYYKCTGCGERFYYDQYEPSEWDSGIYPGQDGAAKAVADHTLDSGPGHPSWTALKDPIYEIVTELEDGQSFESICGYVCTRCGLEKGPDDV